ncbi:MAG: DEAD/DEAH box helicase [Candidatus Hodarchaeales archaeon]
MRIALSNRGKELKFAITPSSLNEAAYIQGLFSTYTPNMDGSVNVPVCQSNWLVLQEAENVDANLHAQIEMTKMARLHEQQQVLNYAMTELQKEFIQPIKLGKINPQPRIAVSPTLYSHQVATLNFLDSIRDKCKSHALFFEQGTGKTLTSIMWAEHLLEIGAVSRVLVVAPLMTLENSWLADLRKFSYLEAKVFWTQKQGKYGLKHRTSVLESNSEFVLVNPDGMRVHQDLLKEAKFDMMILDESSCIKNWESKAFHAACNIAGLISYKLILNGTPAPNSPLDLWSQFYWLDGGIVLDKSFMEFRMEYMHKIQEFWKPKKDSMVKLNRRIAPFQINFRKTEVLDLPDRMRVLKLIPLSSEQRSFYNDLETEQFAEYEEQQVSFRTLLPKFTKLRQVTGGFFIPDHEDHEKPIPKDFRANSKLACLKELVEEISADPENQGIIWISFRHEVKIIETLLKKMRVRFATIYGGTNKNTAMQSIKDFTTSKKIRFLIGHPASIGVGTNLQSSNYSIYYSLTENLQHHLQSLDRNHRSGQTKKVTVYYLVAKNTYDERLVVSLVRKEDIQSYIVSGFRVSSLREPNIEEEWKISDA